MLDQVFDSTNTHRLCQVYSQIVISNLSRWMLAAARTQDAGDVAAGRLPLDRIESHTESGLRILGEKTARSHGD